MADYKKRQEEGFGKLKEILQKKGTTETMQKYIKQLEDMFVWYVVIDLNWEMILHKSQELNGDELEKLLLQVVEIVEDYDE